MEENWELEQLKELELGSRDYRQKALLSATQALLIEQEQRLEQLAGELDGTLWSPQKWRE